MNQILKDLYRIDPSLKKNEVELKQLVQKLLEVAPEMRMSKTAANHLCEQLKQRANELEGAPTFSRNHFIINFFTMFNRLLYPFLGGVFATVLVAVTIFSISPRLPSQPKNTPQAAEQIADEAISLTLKGGVVDTKANAFGELPALSAIASSRPQSGGGMGGGGQEGTIQTKIGESMLVTNFYGFRYTYKGEPVPLAESTIPVYKQFFTPPDDSVLVKLARQFNLGAIDLSGFKNMNVQSLSLLQDEPFGYLFNIDLVGGSVSVSENWFKWENPYINCQGDTACLEAANIKLKDVPADEQLIAIADAFLSEHSVDRSFYGNPLAKRLWEENQDFSGSPDSVVHEAIPVIYPLEIDGLPVFDQSGQNVGLWVNISLRHKRVMSVYNLKSETYERSSYAAVTDWKEVEKFLEAGNQSGGSEVAKTEEVELGRPERVLLSLYQPLTDGKSTTLLVPALRFPVIKKPENYFYPPSVTIPLAKELIDSISPSGGLAAY